MPEQGIQSDEAAYNAFVNAFCEVAGFQGRCAYCLMSIYVVNPGLFE